MLSPAGDAGEGGAAMILVFGSINIDVVVPLPGLPKPGETVLGGDYALLPGGKGANQALAARRAGSAVAMAGAVGEDGFAETALANLRAAGVDLGLVRRSSLPTGLAAIMVGGGDNLIAVASGANRAAAAADVPDAAFRPGTILVCQMEVPATETSALIRRGAARGSRTILNLAPAMPLDPALLGDIDYLVTNEGEAATLGPEPAALARSLRQALIVTRGAAGATAFLADGGRIAVPAPPITPVDTTGAGDTFVGVLAAALEQGHTLPAALRRASVAAGIACLAAGAQSAMPQSAAIEQAVARLPV
ncbi:MAG TPA: ribokinase [Stellaceae bacterium]|nr:ribokinase [Stellaceae bacterium]